MHGSKEAGGDISTNKGAGTALTGVVVTGEASKTTQKQNRKGDRHEDSQYIQWHFLQ